MSVEEIRYNLLKALSKVAAQHAAVLKNPLPGYEPLLRQADLQRLAAQVTTAKLMCAVAGIDEGSIRTLVEVHYL